MRIFGLHFPCQNQELSEQIYDCALRSFGITAVTEVLQNGIKGAAGKALLKKAMRKVTARFLGWVGAAWATYEFGDCMDWW